MTKTLVSASALFGLMLSAAPAFAEPSDTYHDYDLHCSVGGAASCARPSAPNDIGTANGLPQTASATADSPLFKN